MLNFSQIFYEDAGNYKVQIENPIPEPEFNDVYYEIFFIGDDDIIYINRYATYEEAEGVPGCLACGGCPFALFRVKHKDENKREIICAYGCNMYKDNWQDKCLLLSND
tara:strand:- start:3046 stop:3369 length:324 start_codon:yes stop_codon:yes gene_type:complete